MTGWDIEPMGVQSVISRVREAADRMNAGITLYGTSVEQATASAGTLTVGGAAGGHATGLVAVTLAQFVEKSERDVVSLPLRAGKSANRAIEATNAYLAGSREQAWNAQRQATLAPDVTAFLAAARGGGREVISPGGIPALYRRPGAAGPRGRRPAPGGEGHPGERQ